MSLNKINTHKAGLSIAPSTSVGGDTTLGDPAFRFMNKKLLKPIKYDKRYFLHESGVVFMVKDGKDIQITPMRIGKRKCIIRIDNREIDLLMLMIEVFNVDYRDTDRIDYKISREGFIPLNSIKVTPVISRTVGVSDKVKKRILFFKCDIKAASSNSRGMGVLSVIEIYQCLERLDFKCFYCWKGITPSWHLDHFIPVSKGGLNSPNNIVPSCKECNLMKGTLSYQEFAQRCSVISDIYKHLHVDNSKPNKLIAPLLLQ